ncbi:ANTAR domain-containing protein [Aquipuribacter sp. SD81]|uniref:ANTAR domain-containing protein n=1 Tax=Aquipuribacter sp. SD81 TaxID=3127703 RepID=UPI0030186DEF
MSGREERREQQLIRLTTAGQETLTLLVDPADGDVVYEELRAAVDEPAGRGRTAAELSSDRAGPRSWVERLTAGLPLPAVVTDAGGRVVEANARSSALLAVPLHRLLGAPMGAFVSPADQDRLVRSPRRRDADTRRQEVRLRSRDGEEHRATLVGLPERGAGEQRTRWFLLTHDAATAHPERALAVAEAVAHTAALSQAYPTGRTRAVLRSAVSFVTPVVPGAAGSGLTLGDPAAPRLQLGDSEFSQRVDGLEVLRLEGPCVEAYRHGAPVLSGDVRRDGRWPVLAARAPGVGLVGVVATPVLVHERVVGVLNVYGQAGAAVGAESVCTAQVLAGALGALLGVLHERTELEETGEQLREALRSRPVIDQAKGIVMGHDVCDAEQAFRRLVRHSRDHNVKVRDLAARLVADPVRVLELGPPVPAGRGRTRRLRNGLAT